MYFQRKGKSFYFNNRVENETVLHSYTIFFIEYIFLDSQDSFYASSSCVAFFSSLSFSLSLSLSLSEFLEIIRNNSWRFSYVFQNFFSSFLGLSDVSSGFSKDFFFLIWQFSRFLKAFFPQMFFFP